MNPQTTAAPTARAIDLLAELFVEASRAAAVPEDTVQLRPLAGQAELHYQEHGNYRSFQVWVGSETSHSLQIPICPADCEFPGQWYGAQQMQDQEGNVWRRSIRAVVDNFGDLVEVRS